MPKPWIKSWVCSLNKPKIMTLPANQFRCWQILQWIAGEYDKDGLLPPVSECAYIMHDDPENTELMMYALMNRGLLELGPDGWRLHDWLDWQNRKPSDEPERVRERVARHRASHNVTPRNAIHDVTENVTRRNAGNAVKSENRGELKETDAYASAKKSAATRIPDQWPSDVDSTRMQALGQSLGLSFQQVADHIAEFHAYWLSADKNATSTNWFKRWESKIRGDLATGRISIEGKARVNGARPVTVNEQRLKNTMAAGEGFDRILEGQKSDGQRKLQKGDGATRRGIQPGQQRREDVHLLAAPPNDKQ